MESTAIGLTNGAAATAGGGAGRTDDVADCLRPGQDALRRMFEAEGASAPVVIWSPAETDPRTAEAQHFHRAMQEIAGADGRVAAEAFREEDFSRFDEWLTLLDVEDGRSFRYARFGSGIAAVRGFSMLGRTTGEIAGHVGQFLTAVHRAALTERRWVLTVYEAQRQVFARSWERLTVPLFDGERVVRFAGINVPDNELRAGLEIIPDPVIVADENQVVRYANRAAREAFDRTRIEDAEPDLFDFSGLDLALPVSPADLARTGAVHDTVCLSLRRTLVQSFRLTISGARLWGHAFYVITLRPVLD